MATSSPLSALSPAYIDFLRAAYDRDPGALDQSWRTLFEMLDEIEARPPSGPALLAEALRDRGHLSANLDPLGTAAPAADAVAAPSALDEPELRRVYCGTLAVETAHIDLPELRDWLCRAVEAPVPPVPREDRLGTLHALIEAEEFEAFLGRKFPTKKRFGLEGAEALMPLLRRVLEQAAAAGVEHAVIGTMHRGRLNIMANLLRRPLARLLAEVQGRHPFPADAPRAGDVPYHLGADAALTFGGRALRITLLSNPSHLEAVDPVVLGQVRALQELQADGARKILPIILHTDAAVVGQGVVAETLQLAGTRHFGTGGTLHLVVNNQIGFTTEAEEARSSRHCTGPWKATDSAILHVNGDDPMAARRAADLAVAWRQAQGRDAVIDLVCYRRNGHNEIDEPGFTQPVLYGRIAKHPSVTAQYAALLVRDGLSDQAGVDAFAAACRTRFQTAFEAADGFRSNESGYPDGRGPQPAAGEPVTGVVEPRLRALSEQLAAAPDGAVLHARMGRILRQRVIGEDGIAWPLAEALAFGSLLTDGVPVRLSGQDVARGAFSHRHFALADAETGARHVALEGLGGGQARFQACNSPLSEYAVLGFEYGYSLARPDSLVLWEAQFGDFANGAQIVIDQFIMAGEEKWCDPSALVMLLPHGLEGQGPEHSSARLERYLQMAARDNVWIVNPSTPANIFHLLRGQGLAGRKPLIVISPKKLLRLPAAVSPLSDFLPGARFQPVIASVPPGEVGTVLLCSGKIAYDLEQERAGRGEDSVAVVRIEQLYPLPSEALLALFRRWTAARFAWVQEEPENMGAWTWLDRQLERLLEQAGTAVPRAAYVGRSASPSPAGGFHADHDADQARIVAEALGLHAAAAVRPVLTRAG